MNLSQEKGDCLFDWCPHPVLYDSEKKKAHRSTQVSCGRYTCLPPTTSRSMNDQEATGGAKGRIETITSFFMNMLAAAAELERRGMWWWSCLATLRVPGYLYTQIHMHGPPSFSFILLPSSFLPTIPSFLPPSLVFLPSFLHTTPSFLVPYISHDMKMYKETLGPTPHPPLPRSLSPPPPQ
jgi:hypothetical protein